MIIRGYEVEIRRLAQRLGGGFVASVADLKGCIADGDTRDEAARNADDAIQCWIAAAREQGISIPRPKEAARAQYAC